MAESKDTIVIEVGRLRIRASGRFAVTVAARLVADVLGGRWLRLW